MNIINDMDLVRKNQNTIVNIKKLRQHYNLSQGYVGVFFGVHPSSIGYYENGKVVVSDENIENYLNLFKITATQLISEEILNTLSDEIEFPELEVPKQSVKAVNKSQFCAKNITYLRKQLGLNKSELAKDIGIHHTTMGSYEVVGKTPTVEKINIIARYFKISPEKLTEEDLKQQKFKLNTKTVDATPPNPRGHSKTSDLARSGEFTLKNIGLLVSQSGLTKTKLGKLLKMHSSAFNSYAAGKSYPNDSNLQSMIDYFGVTQDEILHKDLSLELDPEDVNESQQNIDESEVEESSYIKNKHTEEVEVDNSNCLEEVLIENDDDISENDEDIKDRVADETIDAHDITTIKDEDSEVQIVEQPAVEVINKAHFEENQLVQVNTDLISVNKHKISLLEEQIQILRTEIKQEEERLVKEKQEEELLQIQKREELVNTMTTGQMFGKAFKKLFGGK